MIYFDLYLIYSYTRIYDTKSGTLARVRPQAPQAWWLAGSGAARRRRLGYHKRRKPGRRLGAG